MKKVEIGCGQKRRTDGYECCDIRDIAGVDHVCPANRLPFESGSVDELYSRHVIEHFAFKELLEVLVEWNRVLKDNGEIYIVCPNLLWHLNQILESKHESIYSKESGTNGRYWGMGSIFGWQQDEYDIHKFGYYFELLRDVLEGAGFAEIQNLTGTEESREKTEWHLEVKARKARDFTDSHAHPMADLFHVRH